MISDLCKRVSLLLVIYYCININQVFAQNVESIDWSNQASTELAVISQQPVQQASQIITQDNPPYPWCVQQLYRVSGYYSPKPVQDVYTRDTYEQEIKLNGRGVHGASGMPVFNGMVAAPKSYAFGTIIVLPWLGVGQVQDRWWAIVTSDWYDRIDVRLGEWDDGIHRAKSVGLRWIVGWYCTWLVTQDVWFDYDKIPQYTNFVWVAFWSVDQNIGRGGELVTKLQSYLRSLGYLTTDTLPWIYNQQMRELVCRFQIDQLWMDGSEDYCGVLGPQTRNILKKMLIKKWVISNESIYTLLNSKTISSLFTQPNVRPAWNYQLESTLVTKPVNQPMVSQTNTVTPLAIDLSATKIAFDADIKFGETSTNVVVLQKILARERFFDYKITWYFWPITKAALIQFQIKYKLIDSVSHSDAWYLWLATRTLLTKRQRLLRFKSSKK